MAKFKYLGKTLTNKNCMLEGNECKFNSGNAYYNSVQNFLSSSLLSKIINIKINRIIVMPVGLYGCGTCFLSLREERRLRVFETRLLRGPKGDKVTGEWRKLHNEELNDLQSLPTFTRVIKPRRMSWVGHIALWERQEVHAGFWWGDLREGDYLEYLGSDEKMILKWPLRTGMDWIDLTQKRERWWAVVNVATNLRVP